MNINPYRDYILLFFMEVIKLDSRSHDDPTLKSIAKLMVIEDNSIYTKLPPRSIDLFYYSLSDSERISHSHVFFLIKKSNEDIGYAFFRFHKITDKDQMILYIYIIPHYRRKKLMHNALNVIRGEIPKHIRIIGIFHIEDKETDNPLIKELLEQKFGIKPVYVERYNTSDLTKFNKSNIKIIADQLEQTAKNNGFEIYFIENGDFNIIPNFNYSQYLTMLGRIWNDMPKDDADWEDEIISEDIYNDRINSIIQRFKGTLWHIIAINSQNREYAATTDVYFYPYNISEVKQADTGVDRKYRGFGLGRTIKYMMLNKILNDDRLKNAKIWVTGNANSNKHMLSINDELNYIHDYTEYYYELPIEKFDTYLSNSDNLK